MRFAAIANHLSACAAGPAPRRSGGKLAREIALLPIESAAIACEAEND
jgi:hypothetical protein